ncbi:MAG: hypothetical protein BGP06_11510 [Rhizobiales bacterium 65-9]|nr:GGDEF domain-containing protein [Hyphomicrobiales bacterium]OJY32937.1 MAG: hypothetical protein BGP06_11510 [Rhizobiales bacterium 65-9]
MSLHAPTLSLMLVVVALTTSILLLISWLQNRAIAALRWWSLANFLSAVATLLFSLRGHAPLFVTIDIANTLLTLGFAMMWAGFRQFVGRDKPKLALFGPAVVWIALCRWEPFYDSTEARVVVSSLLIAGYAVAAARELGRLNGERLVSRYPAILWLLVHAICFGVRIPLAILTPVPETDAIVSSQWFSLLIFEGLLNAVAMSFFQIALIRERAENQQRHAAMTDLLTGAPNRRALFDEGARLLARAVNAREPLSCLAIDIDHFKRVNDRFGHSGGDVVIAGVASTMRAHLRDQDFLARLGGEEFVCLLPATPLPAALAVAEGLRARIANMIFTSDEQEFRVSISIGVALASTASMDDLLREADRNLYEAKAGGRNRIAAATTTSSPQQLRVA